MASKRAYIRLGALPAGGRSFHSTAEVFEKGASVYQARVLEDGRYQIQLPGVGFEVDFVSRYCINRGPAFRVIDGERVGVGHDGEPLFDAETIRMEPIPRGMIAPVPWSKELWCWLLLGKDGLLPVPGTNRYTFARQVQEHGLTFIDEPPYFWERLWT